MNVAFLFGNGFDRNLNMATSYEDFYNYYLKQDNPSELIKNLKNSINGIPFGSPKNTEKEKIPLEKINWADMEEGIGQYCEYIKTEDDAKKIFTDIRENMTKYFSIEDDKYIFKPKGTTKKGAKDILIKDLMFPEEYLVEDEKKLIKQLKGNQINIDIITFNYTSSIEKILDIQTSEDNHLSLDSPIKLIENDEINSSLVRLKHVHGYPGFRMIFGVNDRSQIKNDKLLSNSICNRYIKSQNNATYRNGNVESVCKQIINEANIICLFGLSIGKTDKFWWNYIAKHLVNNNQSRLIIFSKEEQHFGDNEGPERIDKEESIKDEFMANFGIDNTKIKERIYIAYTSKAFPILAVPKNSVSKK